MEEESKNIQALNKFKTQAIYYSKRVGVSNIVFFGLLGIALIIRYLKYKIVLIIIVENTPIIDSNSSKE